jgi:hypothetical protein
MRCNIEINCEKRAVVDEVVAWLGPAFGDTEAESGTLLRVSECLGRFQLAFRAAAFGGTPSQSWIRHLQ